MNCPDCRERLQQWLDARTREAAVTPDEPPALCPACSEWGAAARRLDRGLRLLALPTPPAFLTGRIVARVAAERRRRRMHLYLTTGIAAAAATLLLGVWLRLPRENPVPVPSPRPPTLAQAPEPPPEPSRATLRDSVAEAGSAVAALTTRTADETVAKTKGLLPVVTDPTLGKIDLEPPPDPSARSLRETGEGVTAGLAPVADSARRAVGLFLRELPPMDAHPKTGF